MIDPCTLQTELSAIQSHLNMRVQKGNRSVRKEVMLSHGFRKFFNTTLVSAGVHPLYKERLLGHRVGLENSYFRPERDELLLGTDRNAGYIKAVDLLTVPL